MKKIYRVASVRNVFRLNSKIREIQIILEPKLPTGKILFIFFVWVDYTKIADDSILDVNLMIDKTV